MTSSFKDGKRIFELTDVLEEAKSQNDRSVIVIDGRDYEKKNAEPPGSFNDGISSLPSKEELLQEAKIAAEKLVMEILPGVVERAAKEIIPDIAERIIREEIEKLKKMSAEKK